MVISQIARQTLQGLRAGRRFERGDRILTYHGVVERRADARVERSFHALDEFRGHIAILRRCRVVTLDELAEPSRRTGLVPRIAITFDDGFRNNLLAADLLHAAKLPFTVFVSTDNVERATTIWPTLLRLVLARGSARVVDLEGMQFRLDEDPTAFKRARTIFKEAPTPTRERLWEQLISGLRSGELDELIAQFSSIAMMSWSEARSLSAMGATLGSHGFRHELHHAAQLPELRHRELSASKAQLEARLGRPCRWFAFPNGTFNERSPDELRQAGFSMGLTMVSRAATAHDNPMLLPRIMPGPGPEKLATALLFGN